MRVDLACGARKPRTCVTWGQGCGAFDFEDQPWTHCARRAELVVMQDVGVRFTAEAIRGDQRTIRKRLAQ